MASLNLMFSLLTAARITLLDLKCFFFLSGKKVEVSVQVMVTSCRQGALHHRYPDLSNPIIFICLHSHFPRSPRKVVSEQVLVSTLDPQIPFDLLILSFESQSPFSHSFQVHTFFLLQKERHFFVEKNHAVLLLYFR